MEIWKDIKGYEGMYQVSNLGNTKTLSRTIKNGTGVYISQEKELKQALNSGGYKIVRLANEKKYTMCKVHRLVALAFIGEQPKGKRIINHKDSNRTNNNVSNLEWCDHSYNTNHAINSGFRNVFKITKEQLQIEVTENKLTAKEIAKKYNTTKAIIQNNYKKYGIECKRGYNRFHLTLEFLEKEMENKNQKQIADELGCTQSLISYTLTKLRSDLL